MRQKREGGFCRINWRLQIGWWWRKVQRMEALTIVWVYIRIQNVVHLV